MTKLILVRHSLPEIVPAAPACRWQLSAAGRRRCKPLADRLARYEPVLLVTSTEPKAWETGQTVARLLGKPCEMAEGLQEHDRRDVPFGSRATFEASVAEFFAHPGRLVFGGETAHQAHRRFRRAVLDVIERHPGGTIALVSHGTVMTLFVSRAARVEPFPLWKRLGLPAFIILSRPEFNLLTVVEEV